jgi:hypothetical protein
MRDLAQSLLTLVDHCVPLLAALDGDAVERRPAPGKWSPKEILGHLIDSAGNNQQKFVRLLTAPSPLAFVGYAQDAWVATQHYQTAEWRSLVTLWQAMNHHLAHVIANADPQRLANTVTIDGAGPFRLDFVMSDYVEHSKHHMKVVLPNAGIVSRFANVYGT